MTTRQFRSALRRLGLSQRGVARLLGADSRTARRWALGESEIPATVAILLRLLLAEKISAADIERCKP
jgi:transcriptional regulator with XRE-family HTH domain